MPLYRLAERSIVAAFAHIAPRDPRARTVDELSVSQRQAWLNQREIGLVASLKPTAGRPLSRRKLGFETPRVRNKIVTSQSCCAPVGFRTPVFAVRGDVPRRKLGFETPRVRNKIVTSR